MNCIIYLIRNTEDDIKYFNNSLVSLEQNLFPFIQSTDIIAFYEKGFENYRQGIISNREITYQSIDFSIPEYPPEIRNAIPEYFPHPSCPGHKGFPIGYRHMCDFFSGSLYAQEILSKYEYYLRLDTDSLIKTPVGYDVFEFMTTNNVLYSYIEPAIQQDNPAVIIDLWNTIDKWVKENNIPINKQMYSDIPEGRMYYTNFELAKFSWFKESQYWKFYQYIKSNGGIYKYRWGDAPIKYIGINLFMNPENIKPVRGFKYSHWIEYDA